MVRGKIIGIERDGLDYLLLMSRGDERKSGIVTPRDTIYKMLVHKGYFIGKDIEYSESGFSFIEDLKAS